MNLYQIDKEIELLTLKVDEETGEALYDEAELDKLLKDRENAIEDLALQYKNLTADAAAIKNEIDSLTARKKTAEKQAEYCKRYLQYATNGQGFKTPKVSVSMYQKTTESTVVGEHFMAWANNLPEDRKKIFLRQKDPEPNLTEIKTALKNGEEIPDAFIQVKVSNVVTIK